MERSARTSIATFYAPDEPFVPGAALTLGPETAQHMMVRRMATGEPIRLVDGAGHVAAAVVVRLARGMATVQVDAVESMAPLPAVHVLAPIADRDRMLWLAEKCAEFGVASWRPVLWKRSRSVKPRGEGPTFSARLRARMAAALEQSGAAFLPTIFPDANCDRAIAGAAEGTRLVLDGSGEPVAVSAIVAAPVTIAVGPEGGFEAAELEALEAGRFQRVSLGPNILRFETALLAGVAIARAALASRLQGVSDV
ncbi:MAG: RsmE family RNA methyltransferase [Gemmatimonadaceae bacterium]